MSLKFVFPLVVVVFLSFSCEQPRVEEPKAVFEPGEAREQINAFLDEWHEDAAKARPAYFEKMAEDGVYIGTDKTELWNTAEFREWAKKYFDQGKGWDFEALERNIYFSEKGDYAWFDELLDTWMGDCRASGVLHRMDDGWKIEHYHLSIAVPNDTLQGVIEMINAFEEGEVR